ncbi:MAG: hemolysin family protein [Paludibacteraceae bacterium]|nr:hemolysin family protein [Paludibacteraceae bacterium]
MLLLFIFLFIAISVSFLCSVLEATLMSTTLSYLQMRESEGDEDATRLREYKQDTERPLAAILSLNTIANTIGAAGVGQQATLLFGSAWFGLVSAITTILILVFAEIIPKTLGASNWRSLTSFAARTLHVLIIIQFPIVWCIEKISRLVAPKVAEEEQTISREEVSAMVEVGEDEGVFDEDENKIIQNIIRLEDIKAYDVMTPRVVCATAPEHLTLREFYKEDKFDHFSRIPIYSDSPEFITGYVLRSDALELLAEDKFNVTLSEIRRPLPYFNEDMPIPEVWDRLIEGKEQISIVIDEYGCLQGILTLEDVIETVFGFEITDENDQFTDMQQYARERWEQRQKRLKTVER